MTTILWGIESLNRPPNIGRATILWGIRCWTTSTDEQLLLVDSFHWWKPLNCKAADKSLYPRERFRFTSVPNSRGMVKTSYDLKIAPQKGEEAGLGPQESSPRASERGRWQGMRSESCPPVEAVHQWLAVQKPCSMTYCCCGVVGVSRGTMDKNFSWDLWSNRSQRNHSSGTDRSRRLDRGLSISLRNVRALSDKIDMWIRPGHGRLIRVFDQQQRLWSIKSTLFPSVK